MKMELCIVYHNIMDYKYSAHVDIGNESLKQGRGKYEGRSSYAMFMALCLNLCWIAIGIDKS